MKSTYLYAILAIALIGGLVLIRNTTDSPSRATELDAFIGCLDEKGATFYGAFWCPHCQAQKGFLKNSPKISDVYVECSTSDTKEQTQICIDKGITGYPTWEFADGSRLNGEQTVEVLAEKTGCELPPTNAS